MLGEPLRLAIPVLGNPGDELGGDEFAGECFKLVPAAANDLPQLSSARLTLERHGGQAFIVLTTAYPIDEPVMRVAVRAGCRVSISREYTVLFDPMSISPPAAAVAAITPAASRSTPQAVPAPIEAVGRSAGATPPEGGQMQRSPARPKRAAGIARTKPSGASARSDKPASAISHSAPRAEKAPARPRLQISRTMDDQATAPVGSVSPTTAAEREALHAIEEQTVVLQRQIAELSLAMERIEEELQAARAARAEAERLARAETERAAAATSWSMLRAWARENWPLLVLLLALAGLIAVLLVQRRRERPTIAPPFTAAQAEAFNPADLGEPSVPGSDSVADEEAVVASITDTYRHHMNRPVISSPVEFRDNKPAEHEQDPGLTFDDEVQKTAEESSAYSVLEREQPGIVARVVASWGTPTAAKQLETYLLTPRPGGRALSRGAIQELKLLRSIAVE